jgi:plasmid stabilization system protein ParE
MTFGFHPAAEEEFYEAVQYYEAFEKALARDFSIEVHSAIQNILDYPSGWPVLEGDIRRCFTNRFPFGILYSIEKKSDFYSSGDAPASGSRVLEDKTWIIRKFK